MTDFKIRCHGMYGGDLESLHVCNKRTRCLRYLLHLEDLDAGRDRMPNLQHVIDLGYGKMFTPDITNGCCEYEPINDNEQ